MLTMDWTQIILATIALFSAIAVIGGPIYSARSLRREMRLDKAQDYARLDEVAKRAEEAATRNASLIAELNQTQAQTAEVIFGKMDVLHTLSNSTLTAAMQLSLDGMKRELILMQRDPHTDPPLIDALKKKIEEMEMVITERNKQTGVADLQDQRAEALKAAQVVGINRPPHVTQAAPKPDLGEVTEAVLRGEPSSPRRTAAVALPQSEKAKAAVEASVAAADEMKAAAATVDAAAATVDAAAKTVDAMEKKL